VLKPNMVVPADGCADQVTVDAVAEATLRCLYRSVPAAVPGIAFLSGGQADTAATEHLQAMNAGPVHPWSLSFSYGRALIASALKTWRGEPGQVEAAQRVLITRARANAAASRGGYGADLETLPT